VLAEALRAYIDAGGITEAVGSGCSHPPASQPDGAHRAADGAS
jgi:hypothetical protein